MTQPFYDTPSPPCPRHLPSRGACCKIHPHTGPLILPLPPPHHPPPSPALPSHLLVAIIRQSQASAAYVTHRWATNDPHNLGCAAAIIADWQNVRHVGGQTPQLTCTGTEYGTVKGFRCQSGEEAEGNGVNGGVGKGGGNEVWTL
jgi:hypothetical protein